MGAVAVWAWVGAVVFALVVMGFCAYEIIWKLRRLRGDVAQLQQLQGRLTALQVQAATAQATSAAIQERRAHDRRRHGDALFPHPRDPRPAGAGAMA